MSLSSGLDFINEYHKQTNTDIIEKLTGQTDFQEAKDSTLKYGEADNEHIIPLKKSKVTEESTMGPIKDPTGISKNSKEHVSSFLTNYLREMSEKMDKETEKLRNEKIKKSVTFEKDELKTLTQFNTTLTDPEDMLNNRFNRFSRFGYLDTAHEFLTGTKEYIFFSKPDLHLMNSDGSMYEPLKAIPFFVEAYNHYRYSYYSLQQYFGGNVRLKADPSAIDIQCKYIPLLSNMVTSTLDLPDITATDVQLNQNLYQINTSYREGSLQSDLQYDFSTEFKDTKYLDVYMLFKIYDEYIRNKYVLEIEPNREDYILGKIYPEAISIWKIIVDDTDRIMYWAKAIGCTPMSVPRGGMSNFEGTVKLTINWKAQFVRDMDPVNLMELNQLTKWSVGGAFDRREFNPSSTGETWVKYPYIVSDGGKSGSIHTSTRTGDFTEDKKKKFYRLVWVAG